MEVRTVNEIKVVVRLKGPMKSEAEKMNSDVWERCDNVLINKRDKEKFEFSRIYDENSATEIIYNDVLSPVINDAINGKSGTVIAYGYTGSGKTFSMVGNRGSPGLIVLAARHILKKLEDPNRNLPVHLHVSYVELYKNSVLDLLNSQKDLKLYSTSEELVIKDLTEMPVNAELDAMKILEAGESKRHYGSTRLNAKSSRSHSIFQLILKPVTQRPSSATVINLIDLAGFESASMTGASGIILEEAGWINSSLTALGRVISSLARCKEGSLKTEHVPYRDSKLTRIIESSFTEKSSNVIICTVSPASNEETQLTLQFGTMARNVRVLPIKKPISKKGSIVEMQLEIERLNHLLELKAKEEERCKELEEKLKRAEELLEISKILDTQGGTQGQGNIQEAKKGIKQKADTTMPGSNVGILDHVPSSLDITNTTQPLRKTRAVVGNAIKKQQRKSPSENHVPPLNISLSSDDEVFVAVTPQSGRRVDDVSSISAMKKKGRSVCRARSIKLLEPTRAPRKIKSMAADNRRCYNCRTDQTSAWRHDCENNLSCNSCALYLAEYGTPRPSRLWCNSIKRRRTTKSGSRVQPMEDTYEESP